MLAEALLHSGEGFRGLLESFNFLVLQKLRNVQQNDQAALELSDAGHIVRFALSEDAAWRFDFGRRNFQNFGCGVDDQTDEFVFEFHNKNAVLFVGLNFDLTEAFAQIHHGDDLAAQVDHALDRIGGARNRSDLGDANDFAHRSDADAKRLVPDAKPDDLKVFVR